MTTPQSNAASPGRTETPWLIRYAPKPAADLCLFCFPYAGGSAAAYRTWSSCLGPTIEVCAVELPGRGSRINEPLFYRLGPMVESAAEHLGRHIDRPFAFFGHSMGALVGLQVARRLVTANRPCPTHLFVSAHRAPHLPDPHQPLHALPSAELVDALRNMGGGHESVLRDADLMRLLLPSVRADLEVCETFVHSAGTPLPCPITAFGGVDDSRVTREELAAWWHHTSRAFSLHMVPGGHFYLQHAQSTLLTLMLSELGRRTSAC